MADHIIDESPSMCRFSPETRREFAVIDLLDDLRAIETAVDWQAEITLSDSECGRRLQVLNAYLTERLARMRDGIAGLNEI